MSDVNATVTGIQGTPCSASAPSNGDTWLFNSTSGAWEPGAPPQPLEPWVGTVDTQAQVIQRIPWTCRTTGGAASSTGVVVTIPTDKAVSMTVSTVVRFPSSVSGAKMQTSMIVIANSGGTLTSPDIQPVLGPSCGTMPSTGTPTFQLAVSGTTVTLEIRFPLSGGSTVVECQGYVDLMVI